MADQLAGISYERVGSGPPLLLIHGLGGSKHIWRPQIPALAEHRDVISVDMPGFGDSPALADGAPHTAAAMGDQIWELCREIGVERPHIAGNSLGGWVALEMAARDRAESLCLISPAGLWERRLGPRAFNVRPLAKLAKPALFALVRSEGARENMLSSVVGDPSKLPTEDAVELVRGWIDAPGYDSANTAMRKDPFREVERITVPTVIAWGDKDKLVSPPKAHRRPPNSTFVVLEGVGHTPNWDDPELITELLLHASGDRDRDLPATAIVR